MSSPTKEQHLLQSLSGFGIESIDKDVVGNLVEQLNNETDEQDSPED